MITSAKPKCLTCERPSMVRGLCQRCYVAAMREVKSGEVTEEDLVRKKLILKSTRGKHSSSPWVKAFREKSKPKSKSTASA